MKFVTTISLSIIALTISSIALVGCNEEISTKNMEQIYSEQGVPVKTMTITKGTFTKGLEFNGVISGIKESSAFTKIGSKVESIKYRIGDYVQKDAIVLTFPTDDPQAQYFQAKLAYENAQASFDKMKEFYQSGGLAKQDFENAETSFKIAEANWNNVKQSVMFKAPISGILTSLNVKESENVEKDSKLFTIAQIDKLKSRLWVSDRDINSIVIGQHVKAEWNGNKISGIVSQVDLSMNQMKKAFAVDVEFQNQDHKVRPGVTAKITLETYTKENSIFIERKNIIKQDTVQFVFINNNGTAQKKIIETGIESGTDVEVTQGLQDGDKLIVEGQMLLEDNVKINVITE